MTYIERIFDASTGEITEQPLSAKQIAEIEANIAKAQADLETQAAKAHEKAALLAKLGITEDEAKLLLS